MNEQGLEHLSPGRDGVPEQPQGSSAGAPSLNGSVSADPEVVEQATRRKFTAEYKARIVREVDRSRPGEIGALLRREGLYSSHLVAWRKQLREHGLRGLQGKKRGPAPKPKPSQREIELEREKRRLEKRLAKAEAIIAFQKKVHELLGIPLSNPESEGDE